MVVRVERLSGASLFEPLFAKRGKGGKEKKKPKKEREKKHPQDKEGQQGWFNRLRNQLPLPVRRRAQKPGRFTDFVRAHRRPKGGKKKEKG